MNGFGVLLLAAGIMGLALAWSAVCDRIARRRMRGAPVSADQRWRREHPHEEAASAFDWDADAARRASKARTLTPQRPQGGMLAIPDSNIGDGVIALDAEGAGPK
jgi:hypothetical protein